MNIELTNFTSDQRRALFELLILATCADGHPTTIKNELLQQLLAAMGHTEESDQQREFDEAATRLRPFAQSVQKAKDQSLLLVALFISRSEQKQVYAVVQQILATDQHVSSWESTLLSELRLRFRL